MSNVAVLLSSFNGGKYLREQLDSLTNQVDVSINIIVRDDGSTDETIDILCEYAEKGLLKWYTGENLKPLGSFMHLLLNCPPADYYAFCDQDDVWLPDKIKDTMALMMKDEKDYPNRPIIIHTDMKVVDSDLNVICDSFWECNGIRPEILNNFKDLACYNGVNGCTILMNNHARNIIKEKYFVQNQFIHDVFCALTVSANGGIIDYLDKQTMLYRQHLGNVVGVDHVTKYRYFKRLKSLIPVVINNYNNYVTVNRIGQISLISYVVHKVKYIFTKKHGIRL